jgi:SAM-dependent methyltransferase
MSNQTLSEFYHKSLAHHYNRKIMPQDRVLEIGCGKGGLLKCLQGDRTGIERDQPLAAEAAKENPDCRIIGADANNPDTLKGETFDIIILSDTLAGSEDVQTLMETAGRFSHRDTKLVMNNYNTLWRPPIAVGTMLGVAEGPGKNWLSQGDVENLAELADWEPFLREAILILPIPLPIVGDWVNRWIAPCLSWFCLGLFTTCRKRTPRPAKKVSIVIPTRNEAGTIHQAIDRMPKFGKEVELIFVEGNSTDNTWEVIQGLPDRHSEGAIIKLQQPGKGKGDAVRTGFAAATGEILTILDGDLTMPPEDLPKYVTALESGKADFANGSRLVYNMEQNAMQFANLVANKSFGLIFSWLLGQQLKDTLCGTKTLWKKDYQRIVENRAYFGDFDPFGDFDLLFGAAKQNLKIRDIPIHYKERKYGSTNIQRWRHGVILLRMVVFAARKLKFTA